MVRLTDVKVAPQYRERVRHRLVVLTYAGTRTDGSRPSRRDQRSKRRALAKALAG